MAEVLTPQQLMAVENRGGNLLVSAAAGSGKTKVLVDRLMSYLTDPIKPENIDSFLMITYTKAAAAELRGKIATKLSKAIAENPGNRHLRSQMQRLYLTKISTVHSFCADILKEYAYMLDVSGDFRVADEKECLQLQAAALEHILNDAYAQAEPDPDFYLFIDSQGLGRDDRKVPQLILDVYRKVKCHLNYEQWLDQCLENCSASNAADVSQTPWGKYLIDDLKEYLLLQINSVKKCAELANLDPEMQKPAALLFDTVAQLEKLYRCSTWDEFYSFRNINYGTLSFSKKCQNTELISKIKAVRDGCKEGLKKKLSNFNGNSEQLLADLRSSEASTRGLVKLVREFDKEYSRLKRSRHILDFGDLEHKTLDLLWGKTRSGITSIAKEIGNRYCQIMVDEYQDSNAVQDAIFYALSAHRNNCFMVGDVKQSIYQFRLADPGIFLEKYNRFDLAPNVAEGKGRKVLLSHNFRSGGAVVEAVNDVFRDCMFEQVGGLRYTDAEALREGIAHIKLPDTEIELHGISVESDTYAEEASFVANRIRQMLDEGVMVRAGETMRPVQPEDIVILLRSPGSVGRQFQIALEDAGVACSYENGIQLLESEEVQFVHSLLQVISNPLQDIPLIAVLGSRVFGFTADELAQIRGINKNAGFYTVLQQDPREKSKQFLDILEQLRLYARMLTLPQLIDHIFMLTDADVIFQSMSDGAVRIENLRSFCALTSTYSSVGQGNLEGFLDYLQIIASEGHQVQQAVQSDAVRIMSIHKSKGLEFPVVFLCGLSKSFNMEQTNEQVLCDSDLGLGLSCVDTERRLRYPTVAKMAIQCKLRSEAISEELRVLYVAMTRPKDRLIMTYAAKNIEKELTEMADRMDICDPVLLSSEVSCAGEWVLLSTLRHSEAVSFHSFARKPDNIRILEFPWKIDIVAPLQEDPVDDCQPEHAENTSGTFVNRMQAGLSFRYPYQGATTTPSKLTATQLKGRYKDQEAAEGTVLHYRHECRKPSFVQQHLTGTQYGTAMHTVLQHLRFSACTSIELLEAEIERLVEAGHITRELSEHLNFNDILRFFETDVGRRLCSGAECVREFKFSLLDDADRYVEDVQNEFVLLQGVVDCALIEEDGITVIDFKTDRIDRDRLSKSIDGYRSQIKTYAYAMQKIFNRPVIKTLLYYFRLGELVSVEV